MPEIKTLDVVATYCEDIDEVRARPGAFEIWVDGNGNPAGMIYACPCGCGATSALRFKPQPSPSWNWNGDRQRPTLTPSVHHIGHWHGWLTDGVWRSC